MADTYFILGSYYAGPTYQAIRTHVNQLAHTFPTFRNYAFLALEQHGSDRPPRAYATLYNSLAKCALYDKECRFLWFISDDIVPLSSTFYKTQQYLENNKDIGCIGPREIQVSDVTNPVTYPNPSFLEHLPEEQERPYTGFACVCIRREAWEQTGELDEFGPGYFEDMDWGFRAWQKGWRSVVYNRSGFYHTPSSTFSRLQGEGKIPKDVAQTCHYEIKKKWPFLHTDSAESLMKRCKQWYFEVRGIYG